MPADGYVATPELRFVSRMQLLPSNEPARVLRILQQRWVMAGTYRQERLTDKNSEWRDVPLVEEG